ncbi:MULTISPECIES: ABC transporter ATP-binding protein [unclassified Mesorhizobium]|jgi:multiple sugar transport system ATP-binding protein|uniref:ABC transporter ATP-binding protein n=1 Tax=unclassified Mesorhizobium TaxID=325217 RepID=UPI000FDB5C0F|nr:MULTISPECIES: ABC transporter ATP-binding protein [unclassified Mesorhizobium]TGQ04818.1 ABC transporter ATP-binding protein [Mesorhizobium sp. M2E.F.Ca.ET.219.01.1.1]TGS14382.1 ABC transporter ATP-binding protein [Mesorhizobium sp. M2E.F.Ca.ET.209.01.1.1]TGT65472.1 ABC transporter ATP-binding protein [Mesorhizobium sp. M2E.F.Ca.ET.166.01.1.1]TGV97518.1 ABC transporter ATP-binding protein [Mesorhizobium sp. M2E.F.Ca.ET.154.01.1.1]
MSSLSIDSVYKYYGPNLCVLKNINIDVASGEFLVLLGPSGCGKSTLLHAIAGLHRINAGEIRLGERVLNEVPCQHRDIAMVFQSYALYPSMTVRQNIAFPLEMRKLPKPERDKAVSDVANLLQISHLLDRKPGQLSGGQRQRVAIGRALVREPSLFLFDEPLSNLDALLRVEMRTELKKLHHRMGRTTVYVTHDQIEAMTLANRIAILDKGVVQQLGTPGEVYNRPANLFVATFIGSPRINLLPAVSKGGRVVLEGSGTILPVPQEFASALRQDGRRVTVGIRPEHYGLAEGNAASEKTVDIEADVNLIEPTGSDDVILFQHSGVEQLALLRAGHVSQSGRARLRVDTSRISVFDSGSGERLQ